MATTVNGKRLNYKDLCLLAQQGNKEAVQELLIRYEKYLDKKAAYWKNRYNDTTLDIDDFKQIVYIGFIEAIQKFEVDTGITLLSYSDYHISKQIRKALNRYAYNSQIPPNIIRDIEIMLNTMNRINGSIEINSQKQLFTLTAKELRVAVEKIIELYNIYTRTTKMQPLETIDNTGEWVETQEVDKETYRNYIDTVEASIAGKNLHQDINELLSNLDRRERKALEIRYGLRCGFGYGKEATLEEVGKELGVTSATAYSIIARALKKLRQPSKIKKLKDYLGGDFIIEKE